MRQQLFAPMLGSMFESMFPQSHVSVCLALRWQRLGGRQSVGRGVGGRIVVENGLTTTYGQAYIAAGAWARVTPQNGRFYNAVD